MARFFACRAVTPRDKNPPAHDPSKSSALLEESARRSMMWEDAMFIDDASRPFVRARLRKAIKLTTYVAVGSAFAWLALLRPRGQIHGNEIQHRARVAEVRAIHAMLAAEERLGLKAPPPLPIQAVALDAPWAPAPADAKPWTPAAYASVRLPSAEAEAASAEVVTSAPNETSISSSKRNGHGTK